MPKRARVAASAPRSPCFGAPPGGRRLVALKAQRFAIDLFLDKSLFYVFATTQTSDTAILNPLCDPDGSLFATLLALRRDETLELQPDGEFSRENRVKIAATLHLTQKMAVHSPIVGQAVIDLLRRALHEKELPSSADEWQRERAAYDQVECALLLRHPIFEIMSANPLVWVEAELSRLTGDGWPLAFVKELRGAAFFLLAASLMSSSSDVLETLNASSSSATIGKAAVVALLKCARHRGVPFDGNVRAVALILLENALGDEADCLRVSRLSSREACKAALCELKDVL
jgi:hypothetical protein